MMSHYGHRIRAPLLVALAVLIVPDRSQAQSVTGSITGVVSDQSGAVIPGATVTATSVKTGLPHETQADDSGVYTIPLLQPDVYNVRAEHTGFAATLEENVQVEVNQVVTLNLVMNVGAVQQTLTVESSSTPLLTTSQSDTSHVLEEVQIQNLPLQDRDVFSFVNLMPGVVQVVKIGDVGNRNFFDSNFSVNGGRASMNEVLLDGVPDTIGDFNGIAIVPPLGSVQEFKLQAGNYSAEFGRSGGGIVNLVTRSGGNRFHGELYEYLQNSALNANGWQANRASRLGQKKVVNQRNHFGGDLGGPVVFPPLYNGKERTFFFFDYEGRRQGDPFSILTSVPTQLERRGDFSQLSGSKGPITLFNPSTSTPIAGMPGQVTRTGFPTPNVIPASMIDPVAANVLKFIPEPNLPGDASGSNNYGFNGKTQLTKNLYDARMDHTLSSRQRVFGRFAYERRQSAQDNFLGTVASNARVVVDNFRNFVFGDTLAIEPSLTSDFRVGYTRARANQLPFSTGFDPTALGFPSYIRDRSNLLLFPDFNITSNPDVLQPDLFGARGFNNQPRDTSSICESLVKVHGSHTLKTGMNWELIRFMAFQIFNSSGTYSFDGSFTRGPNPTVSDSSLTSGAGLADFLLGAYSSATFQFQSPITISHRYYGVYVQDDWKARRRLTLNLGLRWDVETGTQESHDRVTYFDFNAPSPLAGKTPAITDAFPNLRGLLSFTGNGNPRTEWGANTHNFGPRIGSAYMVNDRTVVRGGYGIFYLPLSLEPSGALGVNRDIASMQPDKFIPSIFLSNPFPRGLPTPVGNAQGSLTQIGQPIIAIERHRNAPYNQQWDLALQRALPWNFLAEAAYVGSHGVHLPLQGLQVNQAPHSAQAFGTALNDQVPNPFLGVITGSSLYANPSIQRLQLLRPFPQYTGVTWFRPTVGASSYHSLQATVRKRFSHGLSFQGSYTISKLLDLGGAGNGAAFLDATPVQDFYNLAAEKSLSDQDIPQRIVASFVYQIPYGRQGHAGASAAPVVRGILGAWQISGITLWQRGTPFGVQAMNVGGVGNATERANVVPDVDPRISLRDARSNVRKGQAWFNTAAFSIPPVFTFGNAARTLGTLRRDTFKSVDFTLTKTFALPENKARVIFEGEFFNLFNQTVFSTPNNNVSDSVKFGRVFGQSNSPRLIQFSLKFSF